MGEMASTLAHELNQPLAAMVNYLKGSRRLLENSTDERAELIKGAMDKAAEQAIRAGWVIQRLRDFVARGETEKRIESINRLIEESSALALVSAKQQCVQVSLTFDPAIDLVLIDKIQIQQVLVNLLRNALEAMQNSPRRELVVSTAPEPDYMAAVRVTDTGPGNQSRHSLQVISAVRIHEAAGDGRRTVDIAYDDRVRMVGGYWPSPTRMAARFSASLCLGLLQTGA